MDRIVEMTAFVTVAEGHSFSAAAKKLGLSPPTITRHVAALEDRLGARLLVRSTRSVRLTDAGRQFLEDSRRILGEISVAEQSAAGAQAVARGQLRLTAPVLFGEIHVMPVVREFLAAHPQVRVYAQFLDRVINIVEEGIDLAVRIGHFEDSGLQSVQVGEVRRMLVAAPAYLSAFGKPSHPAELLQHRIALSVGAKASHDWSFNEDGTTLTVRVQPLLTTSTLRAAIRAAEQGWAMTRVLSYQTLDAVKRGELVAVLEAYEPASLPVCLVFPQSRRPSAKLMAFVDLASERLAAALSI